MARILLILVWLLPCSAPHAASAMEVDVELVLAVDTSRSMDFDELVLQREGYATAIAHPAVVSRIRDGLIGRIAVIYYDWGGSGYHDVVVPWTVIETAEDAANFAENLRVAPVKNMSGTGISGAIYAGIDEIERNGFEGLRKVIDVSGDGPNNTGGPVTQARDRAASKGIAINGLPIMIKKPGGWYNIEDLDLYYRDCVITGPGAFVIPVREYEELVTAIARKLVLEIAGAEPPAEPRIIPAAPTDCLVGEKLRRQRWQP